MTYITLTKTIIQQYPIVEYSSAKSNKKPSESFIILKLLFIFAPMKRRIKLFGSYFMDFLKTLTEKEVRKVDYVISQLENENRVIERFVRHIKEHGNLYELRMEYASNIYRVFFIFDDGNIVVLFHGFQKKTQKTPQKEIEKALRIRKEYYEYKERQHDD